MFMNILMFGKLKLLMRNLVEWLILLMVRLLLWIRLVGNVVNLLMIILICSYLIFVILG